jgi:spore germination protein YaaH
MSRHWLRHFVLASICGLVPLLPLAPVQASSLLSAKPPAASTPAESAVLRKFRDSGPPVMENAAQFEATAPVRAFAPTTLLPRVPLAVSNPRLYREVFGFAFASSLGDPTIGYPSWNFTLLSTVAYFGIHVDWTGDFSGGSALNTWNDPYGPVPGFIRTAHAAGTKVVLTIAMFDSTDGTPNMCSALQRSDVTIKRTVAEIQAKGVDGVNVDYESNNTTCTEPGTGIVASSQSLFTNFVAHLRAALPSNANYLSIDSYSGAAGYRDSGGHYLGFFDIGGLATYADSFFVMAYDMEYANYNAAPLNCSSFCLGPTAPLTNYLYNDTRASAEYRAALGGGSKVIMGIPYYGRKECVAVPSPNSIPPNAIGSSVAADGYLDASTENTFAGNTLYVTHRDANDPAGATRWDTFSSVSAGCNREMYWDDVTSLGNKYNLVINDHLRGAGIFALNYGGGAPELWNLINVKFGQCSQAAITADKTTPQIPGTSITFTGTALCAGTGEYRFWLQLPGGGAFALMQDHSTTNTWTWAVPPNQQLGTYTLQVDARNQGSLVDLDTYARMSFRLALCVTPTLTSDVAPPQLLATVVTFTAAVTCQGTPEYRFLVQPPGGAWTSAQDYSPAATFRWDTSHLGYGNYNVGVYVRTTGTTVAYESTQSVPYALTSCITAALTTDKAPPQPTGTHIALSGTAHCDGTPQYRFMIQSPGGAWSVVQDFGAGSAYAWTGAGAGGTYNLELDAKSAAAAASTMASAQVAYNLVGCTAVTLASSPASPQVPGPSTSVVLTGTATCPGAAQYRFWIHKPDGTVGIVQDYSPTSTYSWATAGLALGSYGLRVDARNTGATPDYEVVATAYYVLANPPCTTPTVGPPDLASPQGTGTMVTFTASTTTCPQPLYEFWILPPGTSTWFLARPYSSSAAFSWNTAGAPAGDYQMSVWVRDAFSGSSITSGLGGSYDAFAPFADTLTTNPCVGLSETASPPSLAGSGAQVVITAVTACNHANPLYEFWMQAQGSSTWRVVQGYSTTATYTWNSAGALPGIEHFGVWVRDASSVGVNGAGLNRYDTYTGIPYAVATGQCPSVTASANPVSPSVHGTAVQVTITAAAAGCTNANPRYEFWMLAQGSSTWQLLQGYSTSASYVWNTNGAPAGTERFGVWVRDAASSAPYDSFNGIPYSLS